MASSSSPKSSSPLSPLPLPLPLISPPFSIWEFPEVLLFQIASFAVPETERAKFLCTKIATLCKVSYQSIIHDETKSIALWELVLAEDYGIVSSTTSENNNKNSAVAVRRSCKRLRRCKIEQVRDAHKLLKDNTEIAYFYLCELSSSTTKTRGNGLTKSKLCGILNEYGPKLMYNKPVSSGGTFLVEVCRSKCTTPRNILHCVQELVERRGCGCVSINLSTNESTNSILTPLCVAAVRGLHKVVEYLLRHGANPNIRCSGRFRLQHTNSRRSIRRNNSTPIEFAQSMLNEEKSEGAKQQDLIDLIRVIKLLEAEEEEEADFVVTKKKEQKKKKEDVECDEEENNHKKASKVN